MIIARRILCRMRTVSDKSCTDNQNTHFTINNFFFKENRAVYEIMLVYIYIYGRYKQVVYNNTIWRMRFACWVTKAADARLEYVMFTAFPLQQ